MPSHGDKCSGSARRSVDPTNEFLARRFNRSGECRQSVRGGSAFVFGCSAANGGFIRGKFEREHFEKGNALRRIHCPVDIDDLLRESGLRSLATLRKKMAAQKKHV